MSKLHLLIVGFNSVPKVRRLRRKLLVCNASHTWLFLATIPSNLIHYWLGPNSEGFWNLWGYLVLPRRPVPVHARPWWQWCHFPCHLTLRFCILIYKASLYHAFNCQARSLGCLVVKLAVPVKPKGDFHSYNLLDASPNFTSLFQGFICCEASQEWWSEEAGCPPSPASLHQVNCC